ncbi:lipid II flippase Amj family protein [Desulfosporosinus sp. BG]|uniref:lipid II flippase Amj family protein n=1 Tax=Desulfosporosinus sp. BG TaxID=1633135 RepID=UPI00083A1803|nr:lipid II flippase Amj family protein [Desulfosporosinus sp. BG]
MERTLEELIILTSIIHLIDTLAYSVRLNSVKSGQVALSFSLFNLIALVSRTANTLQAPLIAGIIGSSIVHGSNPAMDMRIVIFASTVGTLAGVLLIPSFLRVFEKAVNRLEVMGSVPSLVIEALQINNIKRIVKSVSKPSKSMLERLRYREIPKRLLILNSLVTGIYTVGVLAASYSAILVPEEHRLTVVASSGMINGVASILLTLLIDPKSAMITDQALRGKRPYGDVKALVVLLITSKLVGTLLGQVLFLPAAEAIAFFYK